MMDARENILRVIRHDHPAWVPNGMESVIRLDPPVIERQTVTAQDDFGVQWVLVPEAEGGTLILRPAGTSSTTWTAGASRSPFLMSPTLSGIP